MATRPSLSSLYRGVAVAGSRLRCTPSPLGQQRGYAHKASAKTTHGNVKSTLPSSASPDTLLKALPKGYDDGDRGYLAFTKASLFKLTLPIQPPSDDVESINAKASSAFSQSKLEQEKEKQKEEEAETKREAEESAVEREESWEMKADKGERVSQIDPMSATTKAKPLMREQGDDESNGNGKLKAKGKRNGSSSAETQRMELHGSEMGEPADDPSVEFDAKAPAHSVVFLLHSGQPLSYIASLIEAEGPGFGDEAHTKPHQITFHSRATDQKRWSPATSIGDFLRDAARIGSFAVRLKPPPPPEKRGKKENEEQEAANGVKERNIVVSVPSFEDRTRFLRASLYAKTAEIERMAKLKAECDHIARQTARRFAYGGAVILGGWWVTIFSITFLSNWGWDLAEPLTYLCGLAAVMGGYSWFLVHNREVSYRAVLTETTSRRQQRLYVDKGLNVERYEELIEECKELRKQIKKVAEDYDLEWDQSKSSSGRYKRALDIVERREASEQSRVVVKEAEEEEDGAAEGSTEEKQDEEQDQKQGGSSAAAQKRKT